MSHKLHSPEAPRRGLIDAPASVASGIDRSAPPRHAAVPQGNDMIAAAGWTLASAVLPGVGLWPTRWRRFGLAIAGVLVLAGIAGGVAVASNPRLLHRLVLNPTILNIIQVALLVGGAAWVANIVITQLLVRPYRLSTTQRVVSSVLVTVLSLAIAVPTFVSASYVRDSSDVVTAVFSNTKRSQTRPTLSATEDLWAQKSRLNVLLLGSDGSTLRDAAGDGVRTDTVILASIDTKTGNTVLIQLPRNMARAQFPAGSELAKRYPDGFTNGDGDDVEFMLNAIYKNVPEANPDLFTDTDYPGADAIKLAVAGTTGLMPDYFVMINIDGIQQLVDAMGGVTVNINERLPMGGDETRAPSGYLEPGPNQHLNGAKAMWYARSRHGSEGGDFSRMARQTCLIQAITTQADSATLLTKYEAISASIKNILLTDIPQTMLPSIVDLALKVKDATINRVLFTHGQDGFVTYDPDFELMRQRIEAAIDHNAAQPTTQATESSTPTATSSATTQASPSTSASSAASGYTQPEADAESVKDACAYDPA